MNGLIPPEDVLKAIETDIRSRFPDLKEVTFFRGDFDRDGGDAHALKTPAALLEVSEIDFSDADDQGTGRLYGLVRFEARLVFNFQKTSGPSSSGFLLAANFASWLRLRLWNDPENPGKTFKTGAAQPLGVFPDEFSPELDKFKVWRVEWQQMMQFGEKDAEILEQEAVIMKVLMGEAPEIGPGNEGKYEDVSGN